MNTQTEHDAVHELLSAHASMESLCNKNNGRSMRGYRYDGIASFLIAEGIRFDTGPETFSGKRMTMKECFRNASILAIGEPRKYVYCEGYALGVIPVHHAWVVDCDTGLVVDPTWKDGAGYIGIPFRLQYLTKMLIKLGYYGIIDAYTDHWPILKKSAKPTDYLDRRLLRFRKAAA